MRTVPDPNSEAYKAGAKARLDGGDLTSINVPYVVDEEHPATESLIEQRMDYVAGYYDTHYHENADAIAEASKPMPEAPEAEVDVNKE